MIENCGNNQQPKINREDWEEWLKKVKKLKAWSSRNGLDLDAELEAVLLALTNYGAKINRHESEYIASPSAPKESSQDSKSNKIPKGLLKLQQQVLKKVALKEAEAERQKNKGRNKKKKADKKGGGAINFEISARKIKGNVLCENCKKTHLDAWVYTLESGMKKKFCRFCRQGQLDRFKNRSIPKEDQRIDALDYRASGSYGSGKKSK